MSATLIVWFLGCLTAVIAGIYTNKIFKKIFRNPWLTWILTIPISFILGIIYISIGELLFLKVIPGPATVGEAFARGISIALSYLIFIAFGMLSFIIGSTVTSLARKK